MKFSKFNNPSKKKRRFKKPAYSEACIIVGQHRVLDRQLGYDLAAEYYADYATRICGMREEKSY